MILVLSGHALLGVRTWSLLEYVIHRWLGHDRNHGVTSPLWDLVFGTYQSPVNIRVPPRLRMVWLCDPATGSVRREHARTFSIAAKD